MSVPISILFATARRLKLVRRTLKSLVTTEKPAQFQGIWVVENGTATGIEQIVEEFSSCLPVHYLFCEQANKSVALNHGLAHIPESLVHMTDDDVRYYPETLLALEEAATHAPRHSYFGGPFDVDYEAAPPSWLTPWLPYSARGWSRPHDQLTRLPRGRFYGCNFAAHRDDIVSLGGFDPTIGPGSASGSAGEETDLQLRLQQQGHQSWYAPRMKVAHYVPESRCSPEWAIERAYRHGVGWGQLHRHSLLHPFLRLKAYAGLQWARRATPKDEAKSIDQTTTTLARLRESKWRGRLEGLSMKAA